MKDGVKMPSKKDTILYIYIPKVEIILFKALMEFDEYDIAHNNEFTHNLDCYRRFYINLVIRNKKNKQPKFLHITINNYDVLKSILNGYYLGYIDILFVSFLRYDMEFSNSLFYIWKCKLNHRIRKHIQEDKEKNFLILKSFHINSRTHIKIYKYPE